MPLIPDYATFFRNRDVAIMIANKNHEDDQECTYTVVKHPRGYIIEVHDADSHYLGVL